MNARTALLASAALVLATAARADVIVVDAQLGPGSDVRQIHDAVAQAAPGDTLLVRPGLYEPFDVDKGLSVVANLDGSVGVTGTAHVHDLPAGQTVLLRGLNVYYGAGATPAVPLRLEQCAGAVVLDHCAIGEFTEVAVQTAALVDGCAAATFTHCTVQAGEGFNIFNDDIDFFTSAGSDALHVQGDSAVMLLGCTVNGGFGGSDSEGSGMPGRDGGDALVVSGGSVLLSGTTIHGGEGGWDQFTSDPAAHGGNGGDGIVLNGAASVRLHDTTVAAGGGGATSQNGTPGVAGVPSSVCCGGSISTLPGSARNVDASSPVREGNSVTIQLDGLPNEAVLLLVSAQAGALPAPAFDGVLVATPILFQFVLPSVGATGHLALQAVVPELGAGLEGVSVLVQGLYGPTNPTLSSVAELTLLDASL